MNLATQITIVAAGGALGALGRTGLTALVAQIESTAALSGTILGTMVVNLVGCFAMGGARAAVEIGGWGSTQMQAFLFSGLLGAFTTFSTFEADTLTLWRDGQYLAATTYMSVSVAGGVVAFLVGWTLLSSWMN
ncbi:MAG: CrcB family protein [Bradymonadaceae bacterium]